MALNTRKPTGKVAYPLMLLEGAEKTGKTYAALSLSKSKRVGRTFVLELDEPTADEYASLGDFDILEHNGTYSSIIDQLTEATKVPMTDGKPNVIILDTGTALWKLLSRWAEHRARGSQAGKRALAADPDAEVSVPMNLWNDATDRWYRIIYLLRNWAGIGIITARAKETAKVVNGNPVAGQVDYKIEAQKSTPFEVSAVVRMERGHVTRLMDVRSLHLDVPSKGKVIEGDAPLEHLIFDVLGAGGEFQASSAVVGSIGKTVVEAKNGLIAIFSRGRDEQAARQLASEVWTAAKLGATEEVSDAEWYRLTLAATDKIVELANEKQAEHEDDLADIAVQDFKEGRIDAEGSDIIPDGIEEPA